MNWIKKILGLKTDKQCAIQNFSTRFDSNIWKGDLDSLDPKKIYAYYSLQYGGIYKTMELSLIGNCDKIDTGKRYYGFVRIDNSIGYCQFTYHSLKELFEHHLSSLHHGYIIYEFDNSRDFFKWAMEHEKLA